MITKLRLKNFKKVQEQEFNLNQFELLVGSNNSGKSTVLQALAIWQFCVDQFRRAQKGGKRGIQVVLPSFTVLPLPEFNLLWRDKIDRKYTPKKDDPKSKVQEYIYIEIEVFWNDDDGNETSFGVSLRYQTPQSMYAIPIEGWNKFTELDKSNALPHIVYVPPFSGIEPLEQWMDDGNVRQHVGKSQPGSVIRNLLYRVIDIQDDNGLDIPINENKNWKEIQEKIEYWFGVQLLPPMYEKRVSTEITVEYKSNGKTFDIISGGSGFHQILILLAFYFGYNDVTTILFDEPDAHLHTNLQRKILSYFLSKTGKQFIMATHSTEFIGNVDIHNILSLLSGAPRRIDTTEKIIKALGDVDNNDVVRTQNSPYILYIEGDDDNRILSSWATVMGKREVYERFYPYVLNGSTKKQMKECAESHYNALKQIVPSLKRVQLMDYDTDDAYHPDDNNPCLKEWKRKNIDNYLLVPGAWKRAVAKQLNEPEGSLFLSPYYEIIDDFFAGQNLTLPPKSNWRDVKANVFTVVDGKKILFESKDSLFHLIKSYGDRQLIINRQIVSSSMLAEDIHEDVYTFFNFLEKTIE